MMRAFAVSIVCGAVVLASCHKEAGAVAAAGNEIKPAVETGAAVPAAENFCRALHGVFEDKRASCCEAKGFGLAARCTGLLSGAIAQGLVSVDAAKSDACAAAVNAQVITCDDVGPFAPQAPAVCADVVTGALADGQKCKSSLSCQAGLRCHGAGPVDTGVCGGPLADGSDCGSAVDALSVVVPQNEIDARHPECSGVCTQGKCRAKVATGGHCISTSACGAGARCVEGACVAGLGAPGMPCSDGGCADGTRCVGGRCSVLKKSGEACGNDLECVAGCVNGACGKKCGSWQDVAKK
jgi:hypothetical protein